MAPMGTNLATTGSKRLGFLTLGRVTSKPEGRRRKAEHQDEDGSASLSCSARRACT